MFGIHSRHNYRECVTGARDRVADRFYDNFIVTDLDIKGCEETYSPSLKFSAPNMLGNPFYGAHLKTNGRWHQILNPVSYTKLPRVFEPLYRCR